MILERRELKLILIMAEFAIRLAPCQMGINANLLGGPSMLELQLEVVW